MTLKKVRIKIEDKDCTKPGNKLPPGPQKWVPGQASRTMAMMKKDWTQQVLKEEEGRYQNLKGCLTRP
jgi:hypothetical protein